MLIDSEEEKIEFRLLTCLPHRPRPVLREVKVSGLALNSAEAARNRGTLKALQNVLS